MVRVAIVRVKPHTLCDLDDVLDHAPSSFIFGAIHLAVLATRMDVLVQLCAILASLPPDCQGGSFIVVAVVYTLHAAVVEQCPPLVRKEALEVRPGVAYVADICVFITTVFTVRVIILSGAPVAGV
jgi:hypothetical protein